MRPIGMASYLWYMFAHIVSGSLMVVRSAISRNGLARPCIIELPLECRSDLEISLFASSITITPGTLVLGVAASEGDSRPTLFVHSLYDNDRKRVVEGLREMESRVLGAVRRGGRS